MSEIEIQKTKLCKCGKTAGFIKDYWVTEFRTKRSAVESYFITEKGYSVCGILRRRYCSDCLSKIAKHQFKQNRRLNNIILISIFIPFILAVGKFAFDAFVSNKADAVVPFVLTLFFTVVLEGILAYKLGVSQRKRLKIQKGNFSDTASIEELLDSLNYGLEDCKKIKELSSLDVVSDGEGRVNYGMERSGFNMKLMFDNGKISIEPMSARMNYPFSDDEEYIKRTYINAGLLDDNISSVS